MLVKQVLKINHKKETSAENGWHDHKTNSFSISFLNLSCRRHFQHLFRTIAEKKSELHYCKYAWEIKKVKNTFCVDVHTRSHKHRNIVKILIRTMHMTTSEMCSNEFLKMNRKKVELFCFSKWRKKIVLKHHQLLMQKQNQKNVNRVCC